MIILTNTSFYDKTLDNLGIEGNYLNIIKTICEKPTGNIILNSERLKTFSVRLRKRPG